jgi:hypothetical protein
MRSRGHPLQGLKLALSATIFPIDIGITAPQNLLSLPCQGIVQI